MRDRIKFVGTMQMTCNLAFCLALIGCDGGGGSSSKVTKANYDKVKDGVALKPPNNDPPDAQGIEVAFSVETTILPETNRSISGRSVVVSGRTNLPTGTELMISIDLIGHGKGSRAHPALSGKLETFLAFGGHDENVTKQDERLVRWHL